MIVAEAPKNVVIANPNEATAYGIELGSKFYEIMEGGIYKDKEGAITRELCANAIDSHVRAGKADVPFEVHLPTSFDPYWSIRDFGIGLTDDEVRGKENGVYTTYFKSTKTTTNNEIGAWGLGSKTPFSYVDNFVVTSWKNGLKSVYNMFVDKDKKRQVLPLVLEEPSTEPTGLHVQFAVKTADIQTFYNKASLIMSWFRVFPVMTGYDPQLKRPEYFIKTDKYGVLANHAQHSNNYVLVGDMCYKTESDYYTKGIVYFANIGDVEVTTSREELKNSSKTLRFVDQCKQHFNKDIGTQIQKELDKSTLTGLARKQWIYKLKTTAGHNWLYGRSLESHSIHTDSSQEMYQYSIYRRRAFKNTYTEMLPHENLKVIINDANDTNWSKITKKLKLTGITEQCYYMHKYTDKWLTDNDLNGVTVKLSSIVAPKVVRPSQKGIPKKVYFYTYPNAKLDGKELDSTKLPVFKSMLQLKGLGQVEWEGKLEPISKLADIVKMLINHEKFDDEQDLVLCHERVAKHFAKLPKFYDVLKADLAALQPVVDNYEKLKASVGILSVNHKAAIDFWVKNLPDTSAFKTLCKQAIQPMDLEKVKLYNKLQSAFGTTKHVVMDHKDFNTVLTAKYPLLSLANSSGWGYHQKDFLQYIKLMDGV